MNFKQVKCSISEKLISHVVANWMCDISWVSLRNTCPKYMSVYINSTNKGQEGPVQWAFLLCDGEDLVEFTCETIWAWCFMWGSSLITFSNSSMENGLYKLLNPNKINFYNLYSLGNNPFGLDFQIYLHRHLQNSILRFFFKFLFSKAISLLSLFILYICAFSFLPLSSYIFCFLFWAILLMFSQKQHFAFLIRHSGFSIL